MFGGKYGDYEVRMAVLLPASTCLASRPQPGRQVSSSSLVPRRTSLTLEKGSVAHRQTPAEFQLPMAGARLARLVICVIRVVP
jgi:hypothetical protein